MFTSGVKKYWEMVERLFCLKAWETMDKQITHFDTLMIGTRYIQEENRHLLRIDCCHIFSMITKLRFS